MKTSSSRATTINIRSLLSSIRGSIINRPLSNLLLGTKWEGDLLRLLTSSSLSLSVRVLPLVKELIIENSLSLGLDLYIVRDNPSNYGNLLSRIISTSLGSNDISSAKASPFFNFSSTFIEGDLFKELLDSGLRDLGMSLNLDESAYERERDLVTSSSSTNKTLVHHMDFINGHLHKMYELSNGYMGKTSSLFMERIYSSNCMIRSRIFNHLVNYLPLHCGSFNFSNSDNSDNLFSTSFIESSSSNEFSILSNVVNSSIDGSLLVSVDELSLSNNNVLTKRDFSLNPASLLGNFSSVDNIYLKISFHSSLDYLSYLKSLDLEDVVYTGVETVGDIIKHNLSDHISSFVSSTDSLYSLIYCFNLGAEVTTIGSPCLSSYSRLKASALKSIELRNNISKTSTLFEYNTLTNVESILFLLNKLYLSLSYNPYSSSNSNLGVVIRDKLRDLIPSNFVKIVKGDNIVYELSSSSDLPIHSIKRSSGHLSSLNPLLFTTIRGNKSKLVSISNGGTFNLQYIKHGKKEYLLSNKLYSIDSLFF